MTSTLASTYQDTATAWQIDPDRSLVTFIAQKRLLLFWRYPVRGRLTAVEGSIDLDSAAPANSRVTATIQAASIDTGNRMRDHHVRGGQFFNVKRWPVITFDSETITAVDPAAGSYRIDGTLTMHGVTQAVSLETSIAPDQHPGLERLQFAAVATINRRDFGIGFNSPFIRIGDELTVRLDVEAVRS